MGDSNVNPPIFMLRTPGKAPGSRPYETIGLLEVNDRPWSRDARMTRFALILPTVLLLLPTPALPQAEYRIYEEHPRLLINPQRIDRLRKDAARQSARWRHLKTLIDNGASFPEAPLVRALQFQVLNDEEAGRQAVTWAVESAAASALGDPENLRLAAIVLDWCYQLFTDEQKTATAEALGKSAETLLAKPNVGIDTVRGAVLAAAAAAGDWAGSEALLGTFIERRWRQSIAPALRRGELLDRGYEIIAVMEICHVIRRNLELDLWKGTRAAFDTLPRHLMLGYYPQPIETAQGVFRDPAARSTHEFDPARESMLRRIGEMLLVAYNVSWDDYRFLQGWLRHDAFILKTPLGAPYEFLWVNPYLPGLSYSSSTLFSHDELRGRLFVRGGWEEGDVWLGYINGELQIFADGKRYLVRHEDRQAPLGLAGTIVVFGRVPMSIKFKAPEGERIFVVGLGDQQPVRAKIGRKGFQVYEPGRGGILRFENPPRTPKAFPEFQKTHQARSRPRALERAVLGRAKTAYPQPGSKAGLKPTKCRGSDCGASHVLTSKPPSPRTTPPSHVTASMGRSDSAMNRQYSTVTLDRAGIQR